MNLLAPNLATSARRPVLSGRARGTLLVLELFVAINALYGAFALLDDAEGFGMKEAWLDGSPFPSYTVPALFLLVVVGGGMLAAAITSLIGTDRTAATAAVAMGAVLVAWLFVETVTVGWQGSRQVVLLAVMEVPALLLIWVGWRALR